MSNRRDDPFTAALRARADVVVPAADRSGALNAAEILAWRAWFDERARKLRSSGGRPTNPNWDMKRQISLTTKTWDALNSLAAASSERTRLAPGQVASFLLEDAVASKVAHGGQGETADSGCSAEVIDASDDPRFRVWKMPELFSGRAA